MNSIKRYLGFLVLVPLCLSASTLSFAATPITPVEELIARDMPNDKGGVIMLNWKAMPYEAAGIDYAVYVSKPDDKSSMRQIDRFPSTAKYMVLQYKVEADFEKSAFTQKQIRKQAADLGIITKSIITGKDKAKWNFTGIGGSRGIDKLFALGVKIKNATKVTEWPFWAMKKTRDVHMVEVPLGTIFPEAKPDATYFFKVIAIKGKQKAQSDIVSASAHGNIFNWRRLNNLVYVLIFCALLLWFISHAKRKDIFLRRIPGLDAVEEALGRATEMGRPIYFLTGRMDVDNVSTIAASLILGEVSKRVAVYDTQLKVPHTYALTMAVCQEITKQAYTEAGRPDSYREDINFFITEDQFAYAAAVNGMMVREKPAACFYMGYYYAESLLLAEVGSSVGAIQIAGTDAEHQLPFFFITCDYTLIGEELYAAGAYLSREPILLGTLKGQDMGKAFTMVVIFLGVALSTVCAIFGFEEMAQMILEPFKSF
ncbi:DUF6754 domain-containing protein [Elusimicrobiota bacterium]